MQQRYYDPIAGRFLSVDPIVTDANTGKGFGLYTYVDNNPYRYIDPFGMELEERQAPKSPIPGPADTKVLGQAIYNLLDTLSQPLQTGLNWIVSSISGSGDSSGSGANGGQAAAGGAAPPPDGGDKNGKKQEDLTHSQRNAIKKIDNVIENNAKPHDFEGVRNEIAGRATGFDHVTEMRQSVRALDGSVKSLEGSLRNPNLSPTARAEINGALGRARETLGAMRSTLAGN